MARLRPAVNLAARRLGRGTDLSRASIETVVMRPEETELHDPPIHLPNQLAKSTIAGAGHRPLEYELGLATATRSIHQLMLRNMIKDCLVHPGGFEFLDGSVRKNTLAEANHPRALRRG